MTDIATLPLASIISVLGIPVRFATNSRDVHDAIVERFGDATPSELSGDPLYVHITVREGSEGTDRPIRVAHILPDAQRLLLHSPGSVGVVDPSRRHAIAFVTADLVADKATFCDSVLTALTLALVAQFDRHPIHAAAIARDDRVILLAGPSGAGKSTLAYLALAEGMDVLTDERVWVQLAPTFRVWAEGAPLRLLRNGTPGEKVAIPLPKSPANRDDFSRAKVCVLARGTHVVLDALAPEEVEHELAIQLTPGFDRFPERHDAVVRALADAGGWRLTLTSDPRAALPFLRRMLEEP